jgi:penicillin amidase
LVLAAIAVAWFAWRPIPSSSGEIRAGVSQAATITRDSLGVPHIKAATVEDAIYLQGYATAQDRLWQMEAIRRFASGQLSEVIGPATIETDREARRLRLRRIAEEHTRALPPDDRRYMAAYARGVNAFIASHRRELPVEFTILGFEPREWTLADSMVVGLQMYRDLTSTWKDDLTRAALYSGPQPKLARELYPARTGLEIQPGSNAWALSGSRTATGKPLLANDTHLEWGVPSTWHMVHLEAPGFNVTGFALPGVPAVIIGHNDYIGWGVTNLGFDVQDLYVERMDLQTGRYVFRGQPEQARPEREVIRVKDQQPVEFTNFVTRHGPIWNVSGANILTLRWTAAEAGRMQIPIVQLNQARNWNEFREALRRFYGPGQNFVYVDNSGNIGYQATGLLSIRRGYDGTLPLNGASGEQEWDGFIPFDQLPRAFNPADGMIVTANQNPFPEDYPQTVNGQFDPGFRARQIKAMLSARQGWKAEDMLTVQKDVYSEFMQYLARSVVTACEAKKCTAENQHDAVEQLRAWNGQMEKGIAAPMIARLVYDQLRLALVKRVGTPQVAYEPVIAHAVIWKLLHERSKEWFSDWDAELVNALGPALEEGRRLQGRNVAKWDYGAFMAIELKHPVVSRVPWIGGWFNVGPEYMSGASTTVKQVSRRLGPSMRFIADSGDWTRSLANITLGESGHVLSRHFKDQWKSYWVGKSYPMLWGPTVKGDVLRITPER